MGLGVPQEHELRLKLGAPDLELDFSRVHQMDLATRGRAAKQFREAFPGMDDAQIQAIVGVEV